MARKGRAAKGEDPLAVLRVIDRIEVGPVRVEPRRLVCPYRVVQGDAEDSMDLIYRYGDKVFEPGDVSSMNLATMIGAQVALNYGLFAREIVVRGPLDPQDTGFLERMARATAQEVYVVKFLNENPYLQGNAAHLPAVQREDYMGGPMSFPEATGGPVGDPWETSEDGYVVLSSGGKDSLLSFGLLKELGGRVHPVFLNESGRHWYTALNAYRHFSERYPETVRVWTNSDRVFTWMLRHLPFIRKDFASVRSDEYPVRLWTVAVFVFGALPVARARGAGRLVLGDEHDTTDMREHEGIVHYNGLYDQSLHFDDAMTAYFQAKGWDLTQFSMLRPLSEILIEKVLVERYPDLQRHQVSCHATHIDGDRVRPCGQCEKCRRIVGMLTALGADPGRCGYSLDQVDRCMGDLVSKGIHQEREGVEHLGHMLKSMGLLQGGDLGGVAPKERPEVMSLRFSEERSPLDVVPSKIRRAYIELLLQHSSGSVRRIGSRWKPFDVMADPAMERGDDEREAPGTGVEEGEPTGPRPYIMGELTWPMAKERLAEVDLALLPVGSIEQHGPHLPLDTDAFDAEYLAHQVAAECSDPKPLVLPLIPYGVSYHHDDFDGTISVSPDTLSRLVYEVGINLARQGIKKLVIVNGHGGNAPALKFAAQNINRDAHIFTTVETGESSDADVFAISETRDDVHSGEIETSTALAIRPHLVQMEEARRFVPRFSSHYLDFSSKRSVEWFARTARISPSGVMGDPTRASVEKGRRMWAVMINNLVEFVEDIKGMTLEEIYQRRY